MPTVGEAVVTSISVVKTLAVALVAKCWAVNAAEEKKVLMIGENPTGATVKSVEIGGTCDGPEIFRVVFEKEGPVVMLKGKAIELLRGPKGIKFRQILMDSLNATFNEIAAH